MTDSNYEASINIATEVLVDIFGPRSLNGSTARRIIAALDEVHLIAEDVASDGK